MCTPLALMGVGLAISTLSTGASLFAQSQQASAQADAAEVQQKNIITSRNANLANIENQRQQVEADAREQVNQNTIAGRAAMATARVSAGESGVSGLSVDALLRDLGGAVGRDNAAVSTNLGRQEQALNAQMTNTYISSNSQLNSIQTPTQPNYLGAALKIGQAGLDAYSGYQDSLAKQKALLRGAQTS